MAKREINSSVIPRSVAGKSDEHLCDIARDMQGVITIPDESAQIGER